MKICVIGNCQIRPLRILLEALCHKLQNVIVPSVYTMNASHESQVTEAIKNSDWVIGQLIADSYPIPFVRTSFLRDQIGDKLIVWPNAYFSGYAPEYDTLRDTQYNNYSGPLLGYHSDKILFGYFSGLDASQTSNLLAAISPLDEAWYGAAVKDSFKNLMSREKSVDVVISDYIEENFVQRRLFHILNHPSVEVLIEMSCRILELIGEPYLKNVPSNLFMDMELAETIHPDNPYIRTKFNFGFPSTRYYRGVNVVPASNTLGVKPDGVRIYTELEFVETMFKFYKLHDERLRSHPRVVSILNRQHS